jgi:hypothetical protein
MLGTVAVALATANEVANDRDKNERRRIRISLPRQVCEREHD